MPWLLHNHNRLFTRPNSCHLRRLLDSVVPANRGQSQTHRGLLIPTEIDRMPSFDVISCKIEDGKIPFNTRNGREFRISSIVLLRGGFCFARQAIPFEIATDQKAILHGGRRDGSICMNIHSHVRRASAAIEETFDLHKPFRWWRGKMYS
jgi:hypothetical protein